MSQHQNLATQDAALLSTLEITAVLSVDNTQPFLTD